MIEDRNRQVVIWDLGRKGPVPSAPEMAMEKVMRLFGWENVGIHQVPDLTDGTTPALVVFGVGKDEESRKMNREALWKVIVDHAIRDVCCVDFGVSSKAANDAAFVARLSATSPDAEGEGSAKGILPLPAFIDAVAMQKITLLRHQVNHLPERVEDVAKLIAHHAAEYLSNLSGLAVDAQDGCDIANHGDKFDKFICSSSMAVFRMWHETLKSMKSEERIPGLSDDNQIRVAVLDDQQSYVRHLLLPRWFWKHSEFFFDVKDSNSFEETIDGCTSISTRAEEHGQSDMILIDMDWRHLGNDWARTQGERSHPLSDKVLSSLEGLPKYLLELVLRYNEQMRLGRLVSVSSDVYNEDRKNIPRADHSILEYASTGKHNEGVIVYHYLKAFDEAFPVIVFTADHKSRIKMRETAGPNSEFVSKYELMEDPSNMLDRLRAVYRARRNPAVYKRAAGAAASLLAWHRGNFSSLPPTDDQLVRKTHTRVVALLDMKTSEDPPFRLFGRNFELSQPTGAMCAERSAIAAALAAHPDLGRGDKKSLFERFELIAVLGDPENKSRQNPCPPCGVCSEWIDKLQESGAMSIVMFSRCLNHFCFYPRNDRISY